MSAAPSQGRKTNIPANNPVFRISERKIPIVSELNAFRYLGHMFGTTRINKPSLVNISKWTEAIMRAPLKQDQKLALLRDHLIPKALYGLQNSRINGTILKNADKIIKAANKNIPHLPKHTQDHVIQARLRDGGLGIPELRHTVSLQLLTRITNLLNNTTDTNVTNIFQSERMRAIMNRLQQLPKPNGWTGRDYVKAIHLRATVYRLSQQERDVIPCAARLHPPTTTGSKDITRLSVNMHSTPDKNNSTPMAPSLNPT